MSSYRPTSEAYQTQSGSTWSTDHLLTASSYDPTDHRGSLSSEVSHSILGDFTHTITSYDVRDRPTGETWAWPTGLTTGGNTYHQTHDYNDADMPVTQTDDAVANLPAETLDITYGDGGYFKQETSDALTGSGIPGVAEAAYGSVGRTVSLASGGTPQQMLRTYAYDPATGWLTTTEAKPVSGVSYASLSYLYDNVGQPTAKVDYTRTGTNPATCYSYDGVGRLLHAYTGHLTSAGDASSCQQSTDPGYAIRPFDQTFSYGAAGSISHIVAANTVGAGNPSNAHDAEYKYNEPAHPHAVQTITAGPAPGEYRYDWPGKLTTWTSLNGSRARATTYTPLSKTEMTSVTVNGVTTGTSKYAYWPDGSRAATTTDMANNAATLTVNAGDTTLRTTRSLSGTLTPTTATRSYVTPAGTDELTVEVRVAYSVSTIEGAATLTIGSTQSMDVGDARAVRVRHGRIAATSHRQDQKFRSDSG